MDPTVFFIILVLIVLVFILAAPTLLYKGLKKIADPVPLRFTLLVSAAGLLILAGILQMGITSDPLVATLIYAPLMMLVITLAVVSPFPSFEKKIRINPPWSLFPLVSLAGTYLLFMASLGESLEGGPLPLFSSLLPLTGWILDYASAALNLQSVVYAPGLQVHTILIAVGLYGEVFIIAGIFYAMVSLLPVAKTGRPDE